MTDPKNDFVVSEGGNDRTIVSVFDGAGRLSSAAFTDEQVDDLIRELGGTPTDLQGTLAELLPRAEALEESMADAEGCEEHQTPVPHRRSRRFPARPSQFTAGLFSRHSLPSGILRKTSYVPQSHSASSAPSATAPARNTASPTRAT